MCVCVFVYLFMYITTINEKENMNLKESKKEYMGVLEGGNGRGNDVIIIPKTKRTTS